MGQWVSFSVYRIIGSNYHKIDHGLPAALAAFDGKRDASVMRRIAEDFVGKLSSLGGTYLLSSHSDYSTGHEVWHGGRSELKWRIDETIHLDYRGNPYERDLVYCLKRFGDDHVFVRVDLRPLNDVWNSEVAVPISACRAPVSEGLPLLLDVWRWKPSESGTNFCGLPGEWEEHRARKHQETLDYLKIAATADGAHMPDRLVKWRGDHRLLTKKMDFLCALRSYSVHHLDRDEHSESLYFGYRHVTSSTDDKLDLDRRGAPHVLGQTEFERAVARGSITTEPPDRCSLYPWLGIRAPRLVARVLKLADIPGWFLE